MLESRSSTLARGCSASLSGAPRVPRSARGWNSSVDQFEDCSRLCKGGATSAAGCCPRRAARAADDPDAAVRFVLSLAPTSLAGSRFHKQLSPREPTLGRDPAGCPGLAKRRYNLRRRPDPALYLAGYRCSSDPRVVDDIPRRCGPRPLRRCRCCRSRLAGCGDARYRPLRVLTVGRLPPDGRSPGPWFPRHEPTRWSFRSRRRARAAAARDPDRLVTSRRPARVYLPRQVELVGLAAIARGRVGSSISWSCPAGPHPQRRRSRATFEPSTRKSPSKSHRWPTLRPCSTPGHALRCGYACTRLQRRRGEGTLAGAGRPSDLLWRGAAARTRRSATRPSTSCLLWSAAEREFSPHAPHANAQAGSRGALFLGAVASLFRRARQW